MSDKDGTGFSSLICWLLFNFFSVFVVLCCEGAHDAAIAEPFTAISVVAMGAARLMVSTVFLGSLLIFTVLACSQIRLLAAHRVKRVTPDSSSPNLCSLRSDTRRGSTTPSLGSECLDSFVDCAVVSISSIRDATTDDDDDDDGSCRVAKRFVEITLVEPSKESFWLLVLLAVSSTFALLAKMVLSVEEEDDDCGLDLSVDG